MKLRNITPSEAVTYYVWFLGALLLLVMIASGCGNVSAPELNVVAPSQSAPPSSLPIVASVSIPYVYPVQGDSAHREVWLAALISHADEATRIEWDFGDDSARWNSYDSPGAIHIYPATGTWVITVHATTANGRTATASTRLVLP